MPRRLLVWPAIGAISVLMAATGAGPVWGQSNRVGAAPVQADPAVITEDAPSASPAPLGPGMPGYPMRSGQPAPHEMMHRGDAYAAQGHGMPHGAVARGSVSLGLLGPGMIDSLNQTGMRSGAGLSAAELLGPEILPYFKKLTRDKQDRLRQLHVSMMQVMLQQRAALQAQLLGLRESLHGFTVDAEQAAKQFQGMQDARNAIFQLLLNGLAQQQQLLGRDDWERLHGLQGPEAATPAAGDRPSENQ